MFSQGFRTDAVILIVDDQTTNIKILREAVRDLGEVFFATNGQAALDLARHCRPDVVLLDIELGTMDGYQVCDAFKSDPLLRDAAIIFVTSHTQAEFELQALERGALDFLHKPLNVPVARARIKTHVALRNESRKLLAAQRDLEDLLDHLPAFVAYWDDELCCLFSNDAQGLWFGVPASVMTGKGLRQIVDPLSVQTIEPFLGRLSSGEAVQLDLQLPSRDGASRYGQMSLIPRLSGQGRKGFLMLLTDVTSQKLSELNKVEFLTLHDPLTQLPNRLLLQRHTAVALQVAQSRQQQVGMLVVDVDQFKAVNDSTSHAIGDGLLQALARRLEQACGENEIVTRESGDEFVILVPESASVEGLAHFAERLQSRIREPFCIQAHGYELSVSIGISVYPEDGEEAQMLYQHAEAAMYQAKQEGRNRYRFFSAEMEARTRTRLALAQHMRDALAVAAFEVHYQAKVDVVSRRIVGVEALVRWPTAPGGRLSPAAFIPLAEETGLIIALGRFVLNQACHHGRIWQEQGLQTSISVNVSAVQFKDDSFLEEVKDILASSGLRPGLLELEITEGVLIQDVANDLPLLTALKALGIRVAIDDFGTGYSCMSYLKRLPIDVLKIDQSFVRDMVTDPADAAIVEAIVSIGKALDMELVAEGVETVEQARALRALGCTVMQGYLYSLPDGFEQTSRLLARGVVLDGDCALLNGAARS
ncbi:MAG TPA: EAL domain-containing protein [Pseudomonas sp.]